MFSTGTNDNHELRCQLVAQKPSLSMARVALQHALRGGSKGCGVMIMVVKYPLICGPVRKNMPNPRPQAWRRQRCRSPPDVAESMGMEKSLLHPSVDHHRGEDLLVVLHVDDFLCTSPSRNLECLYEAVRLEGLVRLGGLGSEVLEQTGPWVEGGVELERDPKHLKTLVSEWGMEQCNAMDTPLTREGHEKKAGTEAREKHLVSRACPWTGMTSQRCPKCCPDECWRPASCPYWSGVTMKTSRCGLTSPPSLATEGVCTSGGRHCNVGRRCTGAWRSRAGRRSSTPQSRGSRMPSVGTISPEKHSERACQFRRM